MHFIESYPDNIKTKSNFTRCKNEYLSDMCVENNY